MIYTVIKRDGTKVPFDKEKICNAINKAYVEVHGGPAGNIVEIFDDIARGLIDLKVSTTTVEAIQDIVERTLMSYDKDVAKAYITYRYQHALIRENTTDTTLQEYLAGASEYWNKENANKKPELTSTQRDKVAGITSTDFARRLIFPKDVIEAHDHGIIHMHDIDYAIHAGETNCCLINLKDMLDNGTMLNDWKIKSPHRFSTACNIATQIQLGVSGLQYGGMTISLSHLAPYLRKTKTYYQSKGFSDEDVEKLVQLNLEEGVQIYNYQLNSFTGTNGQSPFSTLHIDLKEDLEYEEETMRIAMEFLRQRIQGHLNKDNVWVTPTFPKIIVVLYKEFFTDPKYKDFINICAECSAKRMVPDYMSAKMMMEYKGAIVPAMSCRSLLKPIYPDGKLKLYGRFNLGVSTLNLPYIAYLADGLGSFDDQLEYFAELCRKGQLCRVKRIANSTTDCAPLLWQNGAFMRAKPGEKLEKYIYGGYASISLGYAGVAEAVEILTGKSMTTTDGMLMAEHIMRKLVEFTDRWAKEDNLGWSVYGTPIESTTYKFANAIKKFGYTRDFITNSIHVPVYEPIGPFKKLEIEGILQQYSTGGNVNYVESSDLTQNIPAVIELMKGIYDNCLYAEINSKHDYCANCGSEAEQVITDDGEWECPVCHCRDPKKLFHARRVCGYIQTGEYNHGRTMDIKNRYVHVDNHEI